MTLARRVPALQPVLAEGNIERSYTYSSARTMKRREECN
jgi:hypothetical protein